jgi:hypothetical protein
VRAYGYNRAYGVWDQVGTAAGTRRARHVARRRARVAGAREVVAQNDESNDIEPFDDFANCTCCEDYDWDGVPDGPLPQPAYRQVYAALRAAE